MTIESILRQAPLRVLEDYAKSPRPETWACPRCGAHQRATALRCEGYCGLGVRSKAPDGPHVWDLVQAELARRKERACGKR